MAKFTLYARTNKIKSRCEQEFEIPDEELKDLDAAARQAVIDEVAREYLANIIEWGVTEIP